MIKGYVNSSGLKIYYEDSQTNLEPILFLHGNNEDHTYFKTIREYFEDNYRLVFIDSRDHGLSEKSEDNLDFEVMAKDVYGVLKKLEINKIKIIGFSDGASIAMQFSLDHKEMVDSLVLVGANYKVDGMKKDTLNKIKAAYNKASLLSMFNEKEKDLKKKNLLMLKHPNFYELELQKLEIPTLNVAGSDDCIKEEHTKQLTKLLNAKEIVFENATHNLILEYPDLFAERVIAFYRLKNNVISDDETALVSYDIQDDFLNYLDYKDEEVQRALDIKLDIKSIDDFLIYDLRQNYQEKLTIIDLKTLRRVGLIGINNNQLMIRIFAAYRNHGYGYKALSLFEKYLKEKGCYSIRVEVNEQNRVMEKLLKKTGFVKDYLDKTIISKLTGNVITLHSYVLTLDK